MSRPEAILHSLSFQMLPAGAPCNHLVKRSMAGLWLIMVVPRCSLHCRGAGQGKGELQAVISQGRIARGDDRGAAFACVVPD